MAELTGEVIDNRTKVIPNFNITPFDNVPIVVLNGSGGVGKDEFVKAMSQYVKIYNYSTIDTYKKIAKDCFNWDGVKDEKGRRLLSDLKIAAIRYNNAPIEELKEVYNDVNKCCLAEVFICMCRDIEEIEKIKSEFYNVKIALVTNDNVPPILSNVADKNVLEAKYDVIIDNSGSLEQLSASAYTFLDEIVFSSVQQNTFRNEGVDKDAY